MAGRAKENLPGGSLEYLFVYLKIRIFVVTYIYIYVVALDMSNYMLLLWLCRVQDAFGR